MRYLIAIIALLALAAACGGDDDATPSPSASAVATATPGATPVATPIPPELLAEAPEGHLVVSGPGTHSIVGGAVASFPPGNVVPSPDGSGAAFVRSSGQNTWDAIGVVTGGEVRILEEWDASWYPTIAWDSGGARFAYSVEPLSYASGGAMDIWAVDAVSGERTKLFSAPGAYPFGWAADGRLIAWTNTDYALIDAAGAQEEIPLQPEDVAFDWSISPDGTRIAAQAGYVEETAGAQVLHYTGLWLYDIAAREWTKASDMSLSVRRPTTFVSGDASLAVARKGPPPLAWSPAGDSIVFTKSQFDEATSEYASELWIVYLDRAPDSFESERLSGEAYQPQWSADGAFVSFIGEDGNAGYFRPHGAVEALSYTAATGGAISTAWAANGWLVTCQTNGVSILDPASGQVSAVLDAAGRQVLGAHITGDSAWSPSGRYVAFDLAGGADGGGVYILDTQTAALTQLIAGPGYYAAAWLG